MVTQFVQNPAGILFPGGATPGGEIMSLQLPRLTKLEAGKKAGKKVWLTRVVLTYSMPQEVDSTSSERSPTQSVSRAQKKDAAWLSQLHSSPLPPDWSAYNAVQDCSDDNRAPKLKTTSVFGPLLDTSPAHPDTVLTQ